MRWYNYKRQTMLSNLYNKYHYSLILLRELVITEFKLRYQGSVLGYLWSLLKPLFLFVILYFVFVYFLKIGEGIPNWPVSMLLGIVLWNFFTEITSNGLNSIVSRGDVIRKINFPKYVIVLASSISALINLALNLIVIAIFMVVSGVDLSWSAILTPFYNTRAVLIRNRHRLHTECCVCTIERYELYLGNYFAGFILWFRGDVPDRYCYRTGRRKYG